MTRFEVSRRRFLEGVGASAGLIALSRTLVQAQEAPTELRRFLLMQRPVGTVYENWWPTGSDSEPTSSRILGSFATHAKRMLVFRDLELPHQGSVGGGHERGTVLMTTGARTVELYPGNGGDDPMAEGPSIDQLMLAQSPYLKGTPVGSLQLSCDDRADTPEVSTRHISYSGARAPMRPYYQPRDAYQRLFGTLMPGGDGDANLLALARARKAKKSVLDFSLRDLARLRKLAPASERVRLDAHEAAIRELEKELDADPTDPTTCGLAAPPEVVNVSEFLDSYDASHAAPERDDVKHEKIAKLHFEVIKAAFRCDLTRVIAFQFSPGTNHVSFGDLWPPDPKVFKVHHTTSHDPDSADSLEFLTRVEEWYAQRISTFLGELQSATDLQGVSLLDRTIVPYISEVGARYHNWDKMPFVLFAGAGTGFHGGRVWNNAQNGLRSTNDFWMACASALGVPDFELGDADQHTTAISGLFG